MTIFMQNVLAMSSGGVPVAQSYWISLLGGSGSDPSTALGAPFSASAFDSSGNIYIAASTASQGAGGNDALVAKYNSAGVIQWQRTLGGSGTDEFLSIAVDSSGNVYATGHTTSQGQGNYDVLIVKYDTDGNLLWQKTLGGASEDHGWGIAVDASGNVYVTGEISSQGAGGWDALIAKYDTNGNLQWQRLLGGPDNDYGDSITVDSSGNVYVFGYTRSQGSGSADMLLFKYNSSGTFQWQRALGGGGYEGGAGISVDSIGNIFVSGVTASQGAGSNDVLIAKYDTNGNVVWQRLLGGAGSDVGYASTIDSSANVYIAGCTTSQGSGGYDILVAKYDSNGNIQWQKTLGGNGTEFAFCDISVDSTGALCISGYTTSAGAGSNDIFIAKLPTDGSLTGAYGHFTYKTSTLTDVAGTLTPRTTTLTNTNSSLTPGTPTLTSATATLTSTKTSLDTLPSFWINTLGGMGDDRGYGVTTDSSGNIFIAGQTASQGAGGNDLFLAKYNSSNVLQWQRTLGGASADSAYGGIAVHSSGNIYIAGTTASVGAGGNDLLVAKYDTNGNIQWQRSLGKSGDDQPGSVQIAVDSSENVYLAGSTAPLSSTNYDVLVVKYNSAGTLQWQRTLAGSLDDFAGGLALAPDGSVYVCGSTPSQSQGSFDFLIIKYNSSGAIQWQKTLGGGNLDGGSGAVACDSSGNVYFGGYTASTGAGSNDIFLAKCNSSGAIQWQRILGGSAHEELQGISVDSAGNVYIVGDTSSQGQGNSDAVIAKYATDGTLLWQRTLGGNGNDYGKSIVVDSAGAIFIAGYTASAGSGSNDILVAKLPADGSLTGSYGNFTYRASTLTGATPSLTDAVRTLTDAASTLTDAAATLTSSSVVVSATSQPIYWINTLGGSGSDPSTGAGAPYAASAFDSSGNIYIAASTASQGAGGNDALVAKYNSAGVIQWQRTLGGSGTDELFAIAVDSSANVYVTGSTTSQGAGNSDFLIAKYDTNGNIQWQRTLGGTAAERGWGIAVDSSSNVYITGEMNSQGAGGSDMLIAKYDTNGNIQWQRSLGGASGEYGDDITVDSSGNVYVSGGVASQGAGGSDMLIAKYDTNGNIQWQRSLGGAGFDESQDIAVDSSGNVYVSGQTASQGAGGGDAFIAKYNSSGTLQWQRSLGGTGSEGAYGLAVDSAANAYIAGRTTSQGQGSNDILIAKYDTNGNIQWQRSLGGTGDDKVTSGISVSLSGELCVAGATTSAGAGSNDILVARLPSDGSLTGTYGSFTYAARTLTDAARTLTASTTTLTDSARTLTAATSTLTDQAASLNTTRTAITSTFASTTQSIVTPPSYWISTLGGSGTDQFTEVRRGQSGAIYVTGHSASVDANGNAMLAKYTSSGALQWQKSLGSSGSDYFWSLAIDGSENLYAAGLTNSQGQGNYDALLAKYDSDGNLVWQKTLGGSGEDRFRRVTVDASGNIYATGWTYTQGAGSADALIVKYDSSGNVVWQRSLGGAGDELATAIATDSVGNVYIGGIVTSQGAGGNDCLIAKYSPSGVLQWQRSLGGSGTEEVAQIMVDSADEIYIGGSGGSQGAGGNDFLLAKYSSSGTLRWQRSLGGAGHEEVRALAIDSSNYLYVAGNSASTGGAGLNDVLIAKYDSNGNIQWQRSLGGSSDDYPYSLIADNSGSIYVAGYTASTGAGGQDMFLARLPSDGSLTGTYGSFTYQSRSLTDAARTLTEAPRTLTDAARTLTAGTSTLTATTPTLTANKTTIQ